MNYIGADLGTSAAKLILTDADAKILKTVSKTYPLDFTADGKSEQDPRDWLNAVVEGIRELIAVSDAPAFAVLCGKAKESIAK